MVRSEHWIGLGLCTLALAGTALATLDTVGRAVLRGEDRSSLLEISGAPAEALFQRLEEEGVAVYTCGPGQRLVEGESIACLQTANLETRCEMNIGPDGFATRPSLCPSPSIIGVDNGDTTR